MGGGVGDADYYILGQQALAGQAGFFCQADGFIKHVLLIFGDRVECVIAFFNNDMTGRAGAVAAAVMVDIDIGIEGRIKNLSAFLGFSLGLCRQKSDSWHWYFGF